MSELPRPWDTYACLQEKLARKDQVDHTAWGLEAGLNRTLVYSGQLPTESDADRAVQSEGRRERHRARLRRRHLAVEDSTGHMDDTVDARLQLRAARAMVAPNDWMLLCAIGQGYKYQEIAVASNVPAGSLRIRVLRLRRTLRARRGPRWKLSR